MKSFEKIWSPNYDKKITPQYIMIHHTGGPNYMTAVRHFQNKKSRVSAHFVISREGDVVQMVPMNRRAWHAGSGNYQGITDMNSYSIGIELANDGNSNYPEPQLIALDEMIEYIKTKYSIKEIIGHREYTPRKVDPGVLFPWDRYR